MTRRRPGVARLTRRAALARARARRVDRRVCPDPALATHAVQRHAVAPRRPSGPNDARAIRLTNDMADLMAYRHRSGDDEPPSDLLALARAQTLAADLHHGRRTRDAGALVAVAHRATGFADEGTAADFAGFFRRLAARALRNAGVVLALASLRDAVAWACSAAMHAQQAAATALAARTGGDPGEDPYPAPPQQLRAVHTLTMAPGAPSGVALPAA